MNSFPEYHIFDDTSVRFAKRQLLKNSYKVTIVTNCIYLLGKKFG